MFSLNKRLLDNTDIKFLGLMLNSILDCILTSNIAGTIVLDMNITLILGSKHCTQCVTRAINVD